MGRVTQSQEAFTRDGYCALRFLLSELLYIRWGPDACIRLRLHVGCFVLVTLEVRVRNLCVQSCKGIT